MENKSSSNSDISLDSLEVGNKNKSKCTEDNSKTILVPFYEKDVLIKIPKFSKKSKRNIEKNNKTEDKTQESRSYLVNKDMNKSKKSSYLEMFRKQFSRNYDEVPNKIDQTEIRSISPQVGDTSNQSIETESTNHMDEFYNTEVYNEIYYEKVMNSELEQYLNESFEQDLNFEENNLRSISEVTQPRRPVRRSIEPPIQNIRLGGLGPDIENIKPRLERAKSLQRYSEKVRMENRVKIYKNGLESTKDAKGATVDKLKDSNNKKTNNNSGTQKTYLINNTLQDNLSITKKILSKKSKSADLARKRDSEERKLEICNNSQKESDINKTSNHRKLFSTNSPNVRSKAREKSNSRNSRAKYNTKSEDIHMETKQSIPPIHINFLVNIGEVRRSSALKSLEEKHRLYQEKIKSFSNMKNI